MQDKTRITRIKSLRNLLAEVGPDHFNMEYWLEHSGDGHEGKLGKKSDCGTVGCAAGWTCVLVAGRSISTAFDDDGEYTDPLFRGGSPASIAARYLGVDADTDLFLEGRWPLRFRYGLEYVPDYYRLLWLLDEIIAGKVTFDSTGYSLFDER